MLRKFPQVLHLRVAKVCLPTVKAKTCGQLRIKEQAELSRKTCENLRKLAAKIMRKLPVSHFVSVDRIYFIADVINFVADVIYFIVLAIMPVWPFLGAIVADGRWRGSGAEATKGKNGTEILFFYAPRSRISRFLSNFAEQKARQYHGAKERRGKGHHSLSNER